MKPLQTKAHYIREECTKERVCYGVTSEAASKMALKIMDEASNTFFRASFAASVDSALFGSNYFI